MKNPTDIEIDDLFERYQKGQFVEAEKLAKSLCQKYPNHPFSWKVIGAIFKQTICLDRKKTDTGCQAPWDR